MPGLSVSSVFSDADTRREKDKQTLQFTRSALLHLLPMESQSLWVKEDSSSETSPERCSVSDGAAADGEIDRRNKWKARIARSKEMESFPMDEWVLS